MKPREFFELVASLRDYEKVYERIRSPGALLNAERLRIKLDKEINRVRNILKTKTNDYGKMDKK